MANPYNKRNNGRSFAGFDTLPNVNKEGVVFGGSRGFKGKDGTYQKGPTFSNKNVLLAEQKQFIKVLREGKPKGITGSWFGGGSN